MACGPYLARQCLFCGPPQTNDFIVIADYNIIMDILNIIGA